MTLPLRIHGLVAATCTPFDASGQVDCSGLPQMVDYLLENGVEGIYACGSTGEGPSLTSNERREVAEGYVTSAAGRCPVMIHVGHNSVREAAELAEHAAGIGATAVSATCPSYFPIENAETLVSCMAAIAAGAPQLPFYYYHIPSLTRSHIDMVEFLRLAEDRIPNLVGLKYTTPTTHEYLECLDLNQYEVLWGVDEMLLSALSVGAEAAIGSTYNVAPHLYKRLIEAFQAGDLERARVLQMQSVTLIRILKQFPFHGALKAVLEMNGLNMGPCRLPLASLTEEQKTSLRQKLEGIGYFEETKSGLIAAE
ncbi:MAG: dihydrodipicolinate synthase family protein [Rubinisphaera brasiliensis]|uniref:dihydrodipicolinate synthase family protein n=1 Tax=Rubinisphaera brasiliensis TaxID=119 RepID=UPI003918DCDC